MAVSISTGWNDVVDKLRKILASHPKRTIVIITLAVLAAFLGKPFNMDDPLFIWAAKHIQTQPSDPYGFSVNWYGSATPMWEVTKNPPLACYYLAGIAAMLGWSEWALHAGFLMPALLAILGTYRLASHFCGRPLFVAGATFFTPVFLVSSTTVMCDVLMLAFWIWAVVFWVEGFLHEAIWRLYVAGILISLAALTKYFAISLIPLLALHGFVTRRQPAWWLVSLVIPVTVLWAYQWATERMYGRGLLFDAVMYSSLPGGIGDFVATKSSSLLSALSFAGGGMALVSLFLPWLWPKRTVVILAASTVAIAVLLLVCGDLFKSYGPIIGSSKIFIEGQLLFWAIGGGSILVLAIADLWERRNAEAWLLFLWVIGTFIFAGFFNWTVNGRTILPMAPAVAILLARRLEGKEPDMKTRWAYGETISWTIGVTLALMVAWADFRFAKSVRESAQQTQQKYGGAERFWFQGHWGFQYYMEALNASALDVAQTRIKRGDVIATPENNANVMFLGPDLVILREIISVPSPRFLATMKGEVGAGFYASSRGPLPFAFGLVPNDRVLVCVVDPSGSAQSK